MRALTILAALTPFFGAMASDSDFASLAVPAAFSDASSVLHSSNPLESHTLPSFVSGTTATSSTAPHTTVRDATATYHASSSERTAKTGTTTKHASHSAAASSSNATVVSSSSISVLSGTTSTTVTAKTSTPSKKNSAVSAYPPGGVLAAGVLALGGLSVL